MKRGVVYMITGHKYAERLAVSLFSLRKHWHEWVTILAADDAGEEIAMMLAKDARLQVAVKRMPKAEGRRNSAYATKSMIPVHSPFDSTVFIDADTVVVGEINELFVAPLSITQYADWVSTGNKISKRIHTFDGLSPATDELIKKSTAKMYPAINTGVIGFKKNHPQLMDWHTLTMLANGKFISDEIAMQILVPTLKDFVILPDKFNRSPIHGIEQDDIRIWHFHGNKHIKRKEGRKVWEPLFREAMAENVGGLSQWAGQYDKQVRGMLEEAK